MIPAENSELSEQEHNYKPVDKIIVVGDGASGKTSLFTVMKQTIEKRVTSEQFILIAPNRTRFMDFVTIESPKHILQCWDSQGQRVKKNQSYNNILDHITKIIMKKAKIVILLYAVNDEASFNHLWEDEGWFKLIAPYIEPDAEVILIGNKTDLEPVVYPAACDSIIRNLSSHRQYRHLTFNKYFLVSVKDHKNITEFCNYVLDYFERHNSKEALNMTNTTPPSIELTQ